MNVELNVYLCPWTVKTLWCFRPSGDRPPRGRGGGRGGRGGRGRGMGRGEGFDSRGKRDFDRHSGTDKSYVKMIWWWMYVIGIIILVCCFSNQKAEEKRGGSGSNNWGSVKDEIRWDMTPFIKVCTGRTTSISDYKLCNLLFCDLTDISSYSVRLNRPLLLRRSPKEKRVLRLAPKTSKIHIIFLL